MISNDFRNLFRPYFWHSFLMIWGIDYVLHFDKFFVLLVCFSAIDFLMIFGIVIFLIVGGPLRRRPILFETFSRHFPPLYFVHPLVHFWHHFDYILIALGTLLVQYWSFWAPFQIYFDFVLSAPETAKAPATNRYIPLVVFRTLSSLCMEILLI